MSKKRRHDEILRLISENVIETQGQLTQLLLDEGFDVTQATVSRDIKELRLVKVSDYDDNYRYAMSRNENHASIMSRNVQLLKHVILSVESAKNIVVIKTLAGSAQGCASALESMNFEKIVGVIAGDDTIFAVVPDDSDANRLIRKIEEVLK